MSQFGTSKNPPWSSLGAGNPGAHPQVLQAQPLMGLSPTAAAGLYNQQMAATASNNTLAMQAQMQASAMQAQVQAQAALQPQAHVMSMQQPIGAQGIPVAVTAASSPLSVTYPSGGRQTQGNQPKQRVFMGIVTKLHDTFGFVDEDVFFQTRIKGQGVAEGDRDILCTVQGLQPADIIVTQSTVKGAMPKVSEKVLVEATFNPNMPFKWNATRVQLLPNQLASSGGNLQPQQGGLPAGAVSVNPLVGQPGIINPPPLMGMPMPNQQQGILGNPPQSALNSMSNRRNDSDANRRRLDRNREREERERERIHEQQERENRERKREQRDREHRELERKEKEREKERERSPVKRRSRSPRRSPKRVRKPAPRYVVQVPRFPLDISKANVLELRKRYANLYVPSDFFLADCSYQNAFPLGRPFNTAHPCSFYMMPKEVEPVVKNTAVLEPPDISYQYSAKVMLLASVSEEEFFRNCCARVEDPIEVRDNFQHPARILSFLVGSRGKNEVMAIGGPWSPSLDGPDPANDEGVLIKTAIRTTKALTGIDLSACGQWYRFLEIQYHRGEQKGRLKPRVETVVVFVPDVWNLMPTKAEWETLSASYKKKFAVKYCGATEKKELLHPSQTAMQSTAAPKQQADKPEGVAKIKIEEKAEDRGKVDAKNGEDKVIIKTEQTGEKSTEETEEEKVELPDRGNRTHWKELDPKTMKVQELREELDGRGLNCKGLKTQLVARLTKAIKKEEQEELNQSQEVESPQQMEEVMVLEEIKEPEEEKEVDTSKNGEDEEAVVKAPAADVIMDPKEAEEKRKKEEKEKQLLERKYNLPETPSILVHPSPSAKGGKFECTVTNLSVLLDYRPEDTKEHSFEVSLFAELFNELLQRDFAFNIYQSILKAPEKKEEKKDEKKEKEKKEKKDEKKEEKKEDKEEKKDEEVGEEPKLKKRKVEEKDIAEQQPKNEEKKDEVKEKKVEIQSADDSKKDEKKKEEKGAKNLVKNRRSASQENVPKGKMETLDPSLLLSCVYFDQNHCGFIVDKDLEDLLNCLGLNLSRAQVRKLMHKVLSRDMWHYRKMTDGMKDKEKEDIVAVKDEPNGPSSEEPYRGNLTLLESLRGKTQKARPVNDTSTGMVTFQGAVVDLASVMSRLKKSEQQRKSAESKIVHLQRESDKWKAAATSSQESLKVVNLDVENLRKKLHETEDSLRSSKRKNDDFRICLEKAQKAIDDVSGRFKIVLDRERDKEDRRDKEKEKEKDKDREKEKKAVMEKKDSKTPKVAAAV